ncbi:MAG TPA: hypothetical protein VIM70_01950 [Clostridium sp.]|uniref:hypothetical protein n=1 Tax=Clostridium sp. TaxID=1506 RepID=UPI002F945AB2
MEDDNLFTDTTVIWRYMNLESFINLISYKTLSFYRYDKLKSLDPYEGANSKFELEQRDFAEAINDEIAEKSGDSSLKSTQFSRYSHNKMLEIRKKQYFINCWHINDCESVAMWDSFTNSKTGIAIKTTVGKLKRTINNRPTNSNYDFKYGKVNYVELNSYKGDINPLLRKTKYFIHEQELRVYFKYIKEWVQETNKIIIDENIVPDTIMNINNPDRINVDVTISELVDELIISPKSEEWLIDLITKLLEDYHISINPKQSDIRVQNIKIKSGDYSLINKEEEFKFFIENSLFVKSET